MKTIRTRSHVGSDGMLELKLDSGVRETDVEVVVVVQPVQGAGRKFEAEKETWQHFVNETAGVWQGEPLERADHSEFQNPEARE
jgi:nitrate/TMAO reductase-like tetraheme cytochrome c subunit